MSICPSTSLPKEAKIIQKVALFTFFSQCSSCFFLTLLSIPFFVNPSFLKYFSFLLISTIHPYLTSFLSWHLSLSTSEENSERSLLSCDLHCSDHFLINVVDKAIDFNVEVTGYSKLEISPMTTDFLSLQVLTLTWNALKYLDSSLPFLGRLSSSSPWIVASPQLYCNFLDPSSSTHSYLIAYKDI